LLECFVAHPVRRIVKSPAVYFAASLLLLTGIAAFIFVSPDKPQYCWLLFGQNGESRVLVCLKGKAVTLEHYANGKPTGRRDEFRDHAECQNVAVADPDGNTSCVITRLTELEVPAGAHAEIMVRVEIKGPVSYRQYCDVQEMADDPEKAPLSHFHGPLTVEVRKTNYEIHPGLSLKRGDKATDLFAVVGTMDAHQGCWVVVNSQGDDDGRAFPEGVCPVVDVEFPSRREGGPPIRRRYPLDRVC
jgi:hypothetical protein